MIRSFAEVDHRAAAGKKRKLAVLAPEDEEFLQAIRSCHEKGWVEPVLIGDSDRIRKAADRIGFSLENKEVLHRKDRQAVSDLGTSMLFDRSVDLISKGQIPTAFIYRSIIREEGKAGTGRNVSVVSLWDIPGVNRLTSLTDTGVNIRPDFPAKVKILRNAVFLFHLLGYEKPRIAVLSAPLTGSDSSGSLKDWERLRAACSEGALGACEVIEGTTFSGMFLRRTPPLGDPEEIHPGEIPEILLVPNLDTGNILVKLDFFLDVKRRSLVITSRGPVIIPSRSDFRDAIEGELALGLVVAESLEERT
ncbi:MAG TPA: phosphate acyltransferase [Syntrophales bacterium]|nr:phosphate acyltransferase [Syntrophales bacterium]